MKAQRKVLTGYAVVWGDLAVAQLPNGRMVVEQFRRGALAADAARASEATPIPYSWAHDDLRGALPCGAVIQAREDRVGLWVKVLPFDSQNGRDLLEAVERGVVSKQSILFPESTAKREDIGKNGRSVVTSAELASISAVQRPAYKATSLRAEIEEYEDGRPEPEASQPAAPAA